MMDGKGGQICLRPEQPLVFSEFDAQYRVLSRNIFPLAVTHNDGRIPSCLSQQDWKLLMRGYSPVTQKQMLKRDRKVYLSYMEIAQLYCQQLQYGNSSDYDYLCIALPSRVFLDGEYRVPNEGWNLSVKAVSALENCFVEDFLIALGEWNRKTKIHCLYPHGSIDDREQIERKRNSMLERFLLHYDISVSKDYHEFNALRIKLWRLLQEYSLPDILSVDEEDITYRDTNEKIITLS
jgi:hypothetical protein